MAMSHYDSLWLPHPNGTSGADDHSPITDDPDPGPDAHPNKVVSLPVESKRVLVVDDDLYLSEIISDVLQAEGHITRRAGNGLEALEQIRAEKPQLILLDLMMPVMNGWELADNLRSTPEWSDIPIVIITANYHADRKQQVLGAKAVITKPFDIDRLVEVVDQFAS
jgi:CheY-like chemotaxis protein